MKISLIFITLALAIGVVIGLIIQNDSEIADINATTTVSDTAIGTGDSNTAKNPDAGRLTPDLNELYRLLRKEMRARQALEQKLETLSRQIADLKSNSESFKPIDAGPADNISEADVSGADNKWFNEQALVDIGMTSSRANELKNYFEQLELERLYLRDQSIREDWEREKLTEAMQNITDKENDLKSRLSESEYDAYLYASGQTNRVAVTSVLASAEAGTAGILSGDYIIRYDNQRIYSGFQLHEATTSGSINDSVAVEIERDGETLHLYVPRGPLGIRMNSVSVAP
jgi:C-terminal processing protease CtpA/Prc